MTSSSDDSVRDVQRPVHVIDGGVGTELLRRGASMNPACWSATAHLDDPQLLEDIHCDYIDAGATIISSNTFLACRHVLETAGISDVEGVNASAVDIAKRARRRCQREDVLIAGSISALPPMNRADDLPRGPAVTQSLREQATLLAELGVDLLLAEMLIDSDSAETLLEACCATGLPVWAGVSAMRGDTRLLTFRQPGKLTLLAHETLQSLLQTVSRQPLQMLGVMHTDPELVTAALELLDKYWHGERFAYAKLGTADADSWRFDATDAAEQYAQLALSWVRQYRLSAVGGCCGTRPEHVRALSRQLGTRQLRT